MPGVRSARTGAIRVDLVIDSLGSGGAQRQLVELALALRGRFGVDARIVVYKGLLGHDRDLYGPRLAAGSVPVRVVPKRRRLDASLPRRLAEALDGADVVQSYMGLPSLWTALAVRRLRKDVRPRWIASERTQPSRDRCLSRWAGRTVFPHADIVTANSTAAVQELRATGSFAPDQVRYMPNGIDLTLWDEAASRESPWPRARDCLQILVIGRLGREKNHRLLIEALGRMPVEARSAWRCWFVGAATGEKGGEASIRQEIDRWGLGDRIEIRPPTPEIAAVLAGADLLVLPSLYEGSPNVVLEAMASRTLVVAAPVGDVPSLIEDGKTGLFFRTNDPEDLARALIRTREMSIEERAAIAEAARRHVEQHFRIEVTTEMHLRLYEELLLPGAGRRASGMVERAAEGPGCAS